MSAMESLLAVARKHAERLPALRCLAEPYCWPALHERLTRLLFRREVVMRASQLPVHKMYWLIGPQEHEGQRCDVAASEAHMAAARRKSSLVDGHVVEEDALHLWVAHAVHLSRQHT